MRTECNRVDGMGEHIHYPMIGDAPSRSTSFSFDTTASRCSSSACVEMGANSALGLLAMAARGQRRAARGLRLCQRRTEASLAVSSLTLSVLPYPYSKSLGHNSQSPGPRSAPQGDKSEYQLSECPRLIAPKSLGGVTSGSAR